MNTLFSGIVGFETGDIVRSARISECGAYRYTLSRKWGDSDRQHHHAQLKARPMRLIDDPTIKRCIGFAHRLGFAGLTVRNLFAFRATNPDEMFAAPDPIGPENDAAILNLIGGVDVVIAAWGVHGSHIGRDKAVVKLFAERSQRLHCFGLTKDGHPKHPLFLPSNVEVVSYGC